MALQPDLPHSQYKNLDQSIRQLPAIDALHRTRTAKCLLLLRQCLDHDINSTLPNDSSDFTYIDLENSQITGLQQPPTHAEVHEKPKTDY